MVGDKPPPTTPKTNKDPLAKLGALVLTPGATDTIIFFKV